MVEDEEAARNVSGPFSSRLGEVAAKGIDGGAGERVKRDAKGEGEVLVIQIEREDLQFAVVAWLKSDGDSAIES